MKSWNKTAVLTPIIICTVYPFFKQLNPLINSDSPVMFNVFGQFYSIPSIFRNDQSPCTINQLLLEGRNANGKMNMARCVSFNTVFAHEPPIHGT